MGKKFTAAIIALVLSSCSQQIAKYPRKYEPLKADLKALEQLHPLKSTFEEHIYVFSPLKAATRDSLEYRERLREGYLHPKTLGHQGRDYIYIPRSENAEWNDEHEYLLERAKGRFVVTTYAGDIAIRSAYFHNEEGWWFEGHKGDWFGTPSSQK